MRKTKFKRLSLTHTLLAIIIILLIFGFFRKDIGLFLNFTAKLLPQIDEKYVFKQIKCEYKTETKEWTERKEEIYGNCAQQYASSIKDYINKHEAFIKCQKDLESEFSGKKFDITTDMCSSTVEEKWFKIFGLYVFKVR